MIALFLLMLAQDPESSHVKCITVGGPIPLGQLQTNVPLKCCPQRMYVVDPDHPVLDKKGELICAEET